MNGRPSGGGAVVQRGDRIEYTLVHTEPAVDFAYDVLFDDAHLFAVAKSGNLPVHAGGKYIQNTLVSRIKEDRGEKYRLAHRLDRETSGVVVMAKTREAAAACEREFRERRVRKRYLAVVRGQPPAEVRVDAPIARREPAEAPYVRVVDPGSGKPAVTTFRRLETGRRAAPPHEAIALVEALPESGRPNQIR
ncbi:MAG: pseudouridine synthase, partial [Candidatus Eiseniibacteriota bacterium]